MSERELFNECESVASWVASEAIPKGTTSEDRLPATLAHLSENGVVQVAHTNDGRYFILMKKRIRWKDNFDGILYVDPGLQSTELIESESGNAYISLPGFGVFEELYIRKQYGNQLFEVYFDLN